MSRSNNLRSDGFLIGIDIGTTSIKAGAFDIQSGQLDSIATNNHSRNETGSEYDANDLWNNTLDVLEQVIRKLSDTNKISAIGVTGQMHGAVLYDSNDKVIEPIVSWQDKKRCDPSILELINSIIGEEASQSLGTSMACGFTGAILLWLKQHDSKTFGEIYHFNLITDFIRAKLLGRNDYATDQTNAFGTGLFNTLLNQWHHELVEKLQLPLNIFPQIHPASDVAGTLSAEIAKLLHLKKEVPIVYGGGDNQMSMVGSGLISPEAPALVNIGTAAQVSKVSRSFQMLPAIDTRPFFENYFALVGASLGGGGHYQKLKEELNLDYSTMNKRAASVPPGAEGLYYCTGPSRENPNRQSGFFGNLTKINDSGYKARAVMEGVLMDLYAPLNLVEHGKSQNTLIGSGKALQMSNIWSQIAADLLGRSVRITNTENAVLGAALLAGIGIKKFNSLHDCHYAFKYEKEILPDDLKRRFYSEQFVKQWSEQAKQ